MMDESLHLHPPQGFWLLKYCHAAIEYQLIDANKQDVRIIDPKLHISANVCLKLQGMTGSVLSISPYARPDAAFCNVCSVCLRISLFILFAFRPPLSQLFWLMADERSL